MQILRDSTAVPARCKHSVIALGNFDGLHLGHQGVIGKALSLAKSFGKPSALMTFEPHPRRLFRPDLPTLRILPFHEKARRLQAMGIDFMRVVHFTRAFSQLTAAQFIADILVGELQVSHVVTGEDFIFGHNREGNAAYLEQMSRRLGFGYTAFAPVVMNEARCSSTRIRALLAEGDVPAVALLLGRPYSISGRVRAGDKRGRTLGFPTANIVPTHIFMPANGVYAVRAKVRDGWVKGVANLGMRPTFGGERTQLEVHLFDWQKEIYGERMEVVFVERLRGEQKFDGVEALQKQIAQDSQEAKQILAGS